MIHRFGLDRLKVLARQTTYAIELFPIFHGNDWTREELRENLGASDCGDCPGTQTFELQSCLLADGFRTSYLTYQPADRFWLFQWIETGIYLVFTTLALGATFWLVKQRLT